MCKFVHVLQQQVRVIARAGHPREVLREISRLGTSLEFEDFFCIHRSTNRNGAFPRISFTIFSLRTFRKNIFYYLLCPVSISRLMKAKNLEIREGRQEQWNPTSTP